MVQVDKLVTRLKPSKFIGAWNLLFKPTKSNPSHLKLSSSIHHVCSSNPHHSIWGSLLAWWGGAFPSNYFLSTNSHRGLSIITVWPWTQFEIPQAPGPRNYHLHSSPLRADSLLFSPFL